MSNLDDNIEIIEEQGSGFAGFRAFEYDPAHRGACLRSIVSRYWWKQGELEASGVPKFSNHYGFYAYINLPLAILAFGHRDEYIFCLTRHWETTVQWTETIRSQKAEIVAIIEPMRPTKKDLFPKEALAMDYPDVHIVHQNDIPWIIFERDLIQLPYQEPAPPTQWIDPEGLLVWYPKGGRAPEGFEELPPAATYPDELHPADQRLRKAYFQDFSGKRYVFWEAPGQDAFSEFSRELRVHPRRLDIHLDPEQCEGGE
jgi:hypothetical protein